MTAFASDPELQLRLQDEIELLRLRRAAKRAVDAEERPPAAFPEALSLKERLARPREPVRWLVEGWLPAGGRAVLAAQAKAGKTTLSGNLVRSLVDGAPFLGRDPVAQLSGKAVVIDFEMGEDDLDDLYAELAIEAQDHVVLLPMRGQAHAFDLRDEQLRERWAALLLEHDAEFVVWDCLGPVVSALGLDENREAYTLLTGFDTVLKAAGQPGALVVHHMGHSNERARGDSRIIGWGESNWKLVLDDDGNLSGPRWLTAYGRRGVEQHETQLAKDPVTQRMTVAGGSRAALRNTVAGQLVHTILSETDEPLTAGRIEADAMARGATRASARTALAQLVAVNQVLVEIGERNARLHRLNPVIGEASSPVRRSSPEPASEVASQFAAVRSSGELANSPADASTPSPPSGELTEEQRAILAKVRAVQ